MADHYIGRAPVYGNFETQVLVPDSVTTSFPLTYAVGSAGSLTVVYGGVQQQPNVAYSIGGGGSTIVFSEAPVTGTTLYLVYAGKQLSVPRTVGQEITKETFSGDGTTTSFTLVNGPTVPAGIMVFVDGIQQREGTGNNFVSTGSTVVFSAAPDSGAEIDVYTLVKERISIDAVADGSISRAKLQAGIQKTVGQYVEITASTTATAGTYYFINTTSGAVTLTLPAVATLGDTVRIIDGAGTFATNNLTISRNGNPIQGSATDMTVNTSGAAFDLVYYNSTWGWRLFSV
jgi:hypothetical protein